MTIGFGLVVDISVVGTIIIAVIVVIYMDAATTDTVGILIFMLLIRWLIALLPFVDMSVVLAAVYIRKVLGIYETAPLFLNLDANFHCIPVWQSFETL